MTYRHMLRRHPATGHPATGHPADGRLVDRHRRGRRRVAALVGAALLLPGLAGCETDHLGAAAVVDNTKITVAEIEGTLEALREAKVRLGLPVEPSALAASNEVDRRVILLIYDKAAADLGITLTEGELDSRADELRQSSGGDAAFERAQLGLGRTPEMADEEIRLELIERKMVEEFAKRAGRELDNAEAGVQIGGQLTAAAKSMRIRINPRYGTFDPVRGTIDPYRYDFFRYEQA